MPNLVRKIYLYDDLSSFRNRQDSGDYVDTPADIAAALSYIKTLPHDDEKSPNAYMPLEKNETVASMLIFIEEVAYIAGIFGRKRKNGLPLYEHSGYLYTKDISEKEGLYEGAHFVYFPRTRQLLLERSRYAPRKVQLQNYLAEKLDNHPDIPLDNLFFRAVANGDRLRELRQNTGAITAVEIQASAGFLDVVNAFDGALGDALYGVRKRFPNTPQYGIVLTAKRNQKVGGIPEEGLKEFIIDLVEAIPEALSKVTATVKVEEGRRGRSYPINLLSDDIGYPMLIPTTEHRVIDSSAVWGQMLTYYERILQGRAVIEADEQTAIEQAEAYEDAPQ